MRFRGLVLFVFLVVEILLGDALARAGSPYPVFYLAVHVVLAIGLVLGGGAALVVALGLPGRGVQVIAALTLIFALGATISGTVFLIAGQDDSALLGMEVLGGLALVGALLLIIFGSVPTRAPPAPAAPA